jgi:alkyl sulfatase BDS1-like metallo-beta-lactamase superfamily hydrolase
VLGVRLNGPKAEGKRIVLNWNFTDTSESFVLNLENSALTYVAGAQARRWPRPTPASRWRVAPSTK